MNTSETQAALVAAEANLDRARAELADGQPDRKAYEDAEWAHKEAKIRHDVAMQRDADKRQADEDAELAAKVARHAEIVAFVNGGFRERLDVIAARAAERVVALDDDAAEIEVLMDEVTRVALEADAIAGTIDPRPHLLYPAARLTDNGVVPVVHRAIGDILRARGQNMLLERVTRLVGSE